VKKMTTLIKDHRLTATAQESRHTGVTKSYGINGSFWQESEYRKVELEGFITVEIDLEKIIRRWGSKAMRSKGRRAQEADGAIVVTASDVRTIASSTWDKI
jgi:hypothetical protein